LGTVWGRSALSPLLAFVGKKFISSSECGRTCGKPKIPVQPLG
jgi:hypothetical protein